MFYLSFYIITLSKSYDLNLKESFNIISGKWFLTNVKFEVLI